MSKIRTQLGRERVREKAQFSHSKVFTHRKRFFFKFFIVESIFSDVSEHLSRIERGIKSQFQLTSHLISIDFVVVVDVIVKGRWGGSKWRSWSLREKKHVFRGGKLIVFTLDNYLRYTKFNEWNFQVLNEFLGAGVCGYWRSEETRCEGNKSFYLSER
jgi:hypothetical protein